MYGITSVVGLDVLGESQLIGYPSIPFNRGPPYNGPWTAPPQFPSVSLLSWGGAFGQQGDGTARYWALKLLLDTFRPGPPAGTWAPEQADTLVNTSVVMGPPTPSPTGPFCGEVLNLDSLTLTCSDPGATIASLPFVAYGTPTGSCPATSGWAKGSCDAANATTIVSQLCLGKASCTVPFTTDLMGDPCLNVLKHGVVVAQCTTGGGSASGGGGEGPPVYAQAYLEAGGGKKVLIVNKKSTAQSVTVKGAGAGGGTWTFIDESTAFGPAQTIPTTEDTWTLQPFSLGILRLV